MIVAIYVRVSTRKQDETNQLPRLREIAKNRGFEIYREYSDEASAKDANRPGWKELMDDASNHKFDAILVTKLDRVMRSLVQLNITMSNLQTYCVKLICADIGEIDCSTPMGKVQMQIIGAIAEWEREIIVQRTKEGIDARKARGAKLGRKRSAWRTAFEQCPPKYHYGGDKNGYPFTEYKHICGTSPQGGFSEGSGMVLRIH
ncbi:recombinase family protein [Methanomethylophilus alvi]|uniref:recombinase family protein n=1 Tax=Methanomethylophilus alvi TaxID=1291540 RepID=UPI0037DC99BC